MQTRGELGSSCPFYFAHSDRICYFTVGFSALAAYSLITGKILEPPADFAFVTEVPSESSLSPEPVWVR